MISQIIDGGAIEADGGASAPVGPTVATPLLNRHNKAAFETVCQQQYHISYIIHCIVAIILTKFGCILGFLLQHTWQIYKIIVYSICQS